MLNIVPGQVGTERWNVFSYAWQWQLLRILQIDLQIRWPASTIEIDTVLENSSFMSIGTGMKVSLTGFKSN